MYQKQWGFIDNRSTSTQEGAALISCNMTHSLWTGLVNQWLPRPQAEEQKNRQNYLFASCKEFSLSFHQIETMAVPWAKQKFEIVCFINRSNIELDEYLAQAKTVKY